MGCQPPSDDIVVSDAIYRPPLGAGTVGAAYFTIQSPTDDRILTLSSPIAQAVELHETVVENGRAFMRPVANIELPAGDPVELRPGARHLMIIGPQVPDGAETFPIVIRLESGGTVTIECAILTG